ncbi:MAG: hypothetical protein EB084_12040 [Proteobacteria bacterium]|nr:hypothetical protein [Pseudomonadota bacterium]
MGELGSIGASLPPASPHRGPSTRASAADVAALGRSDGFSPSSAGDGIEIIPAPAFAASGAAARQGIAQQLAARLGAWPSLHAVVAVAPDGKGDTDLLVASAPAEAAQSAPGGVYAIISALASSPAIKQAASAHLGEAHPVVPLAEFENATVYALHLPGEHDAASLQAAIAEGRQPNQREMLGGFLKGLPQGQRVAVLLAGPSGAGKTSLIKELQSLSGDRKIVALTGDMYFRDVDDPGYPRTQTGTLDFDNPTAMHMDELAGDVARLVRDGKADIPVYDFAATRPGGWKRPVEGVTGVRLERKEHLDLGADDILVIDSIHAANAEIVGALRKSGIPLQTLYLDSQKAEDRLLRRIVRDYATREGSADRTLAFWDLTTFPGEVHYVRPTMLQMDPARDLYYVTKFGTDLGLSREQIETRVALLDAYGLPPTYPAFAAPEEQLPALAASERARLEGVLGSGASDAEKAAAQRALDRLSAAPRR